MTGLSLVKPAIDVGVMTNDLERSQRFWGGEVQLPYNHLLKVGGGVHQHRYDCNGSVFKLNHSRTPLQPASTGYRRLRIVTPRVHQTVHLESPEGIQVELVPPKPSEDFGIDILWRTSNLERAEQFLETGFQAAREGDKFRLGTSLFTLEEDATQPRTGERSAVGWRYLTVQIADVEAEHNRLLELGFEQGSPPIRLGDTAYISFIRDPDGNWIELSQRASLTGPLPEVPANRRRH